MRTILILIVTILAACLPITAARAAEATVADAAQGGDSPTDVPDPVGLGERLALIDWLHDKKITVPEDASLADLRRLYRTAHAPTAAQVADSEQRDALTRRLWVDFHQNAPPDATLAQLQALVAAAEQKQKAAEDTEQQQELADDQKARNAPPTSRPVQRIHADPGAAPADDQDPDGKAQMRQVATGNLTVGKVFPPFSGTGSDGRPYSLADHKGTVVLVVFADVRSAEWIAEIPNVKAVYGAQHDRGFDVVTVDFDRIRDYVVNFVDVQRIRWPVLFNPDTGYRELIRPYAVRASPTYYIIARDGTISAVNPFGAALDPAVAKALAGP
jgi:peroxiredoxin